MGNHVASSSAELPAAAQAEQDGTGESGKDGNLDR
jgi:hypothetical protein